jgi:hypothetical protein
MGNIRPMAEVLYPVKKLIQLTEEQVAAIADYRFANRVPSESEAIRQLIQLGLEAAEKRKKQKT